MKNALLALTLVLGLSAGTLYQSTPVLASPAEAPATQLLAAKPLGFVSVDAKTTGTATIVQEDGKYFVALSDDFTIGEAPAIYVTLYRDAVPPKKTYDAKKYVSLGALMSRSGAQRYAVPAGVEPKDFGSIAIWCKQFDVTLSYATLTK